MEKNKFLRVKEIAKLLSIGKSSWWAWVKEGKAPPGIKLGRRTTVWRAADVQAFIDRAAGGLHD
jgi:predicted DNA-binding transcriptional regulator AlpA